MSLARRVLPAHDGKQSLSSSIIFWPFILTEGSQLKRRAGQAVLGNTLEYDDRKRGVSWNG